MEKVKKNNSPNQTDNVWWRPNKLKNFLMAFEKVLNDNPFDVVIMTDDELRLLCNELLEEQYQISEATFKNRKAWNLKDCVEYQNFLALYKKALWEQKRNLFLKFENNENAWQKYAWIIERKFSEWNLRQISEVDNKISWELKTTSAVEELNNLLHK